MPRKGTQGARRQPLTRTVHVVNRKAARQTKVRTKSVTHQRKAGKVTATVKLCGSRRIDEGSLSQLSNERIAVPITVVEAAASSSDVVQLSCKPASTRASHSSGWFCDAARCSFLADVQHVLCQLLCKTLPLLTVHTSRAFLSVAGNGDSSLLTPCLSPMQNATDVFPTDNKSCLAALHTSRDANLACLDKDAEVWRVHEEIYRTVRSTIAASCVLGHRSCQALWGARGCGKHRILRLVAQECAHEANTLVLYLDGGILRSDVSALRVIAEQMLHYLQSPQSAALRAADWSMRTGVFDFGKLFHFDVVLATQGAAADVRHTALSAEQPTQPIGHDHVAGQPLSSSTLFTANGARAAGGSKPQTSAARPPVDGAIDDSSCTAASEEEDSESDGSEDGATGFFLTTTSAFLAGGASSALPALRQALLRMKSCGTTLVVCIRQVDLFGIWCDQLLYVLSGLMHDADGHGGGMSLLLSSSSPDLRYLEKRLSSRLTCETRYVPLLPWSVSGLLRAAVRTVRLCCLTSALSHADAGEAQTAARTTGTSTDALAEVRRVVEETLQAGAAPSWRGGTAARPYGSLNASCSRCDATGTRQRERCGGGSSAVLPDGSATPVLSFGTGDAPPAADGPVHQAARRESETTRGAGRCGSLYAHPSLFVDALVAMCDELCSQLASHSTSKGAEVSSLALCATRLSRELGEAGATAGRVLTGVSACLCRASAGGVSLLGAEGQARLLRWLRGREAAEVAWPWQANATGDATPSSVSQPVSRDACVCSKASCFDVWQGKASSRVSASWQRVVVAASAAASSLPRQERGCTSSPIVPGAALSVLPLSVATLPPDLLDLLADGHLLQAGYAARELFLLLVQLLLHHEAGITRSVADVLEDISSGMGTRAAASLDRAAFRHALARLVRWRLVQVAERTELVTLVGGAARVRGFVLAVLEHRATWCEDVLGLEAREYLRIRNTV